MVRSEFNNLVSSLTPEDLQPTSLPIDTLKHIQIDDILNGKVSEDISQTLEKAKAYAVRLGVDLESASQGSTFVNGKWFELNDVRTHDSPVSISTEVDNCAGLLEKHANGIC